MSLQTALLENRSLLLWALPGFLVLLLTACGGGETGRTSIHADHAADEPQLAGFERLTEDVPVTLANWNTSLEQYLRQLEVLATRMDECDRLEASRYYEILHRQLSTMEADGPAIVVEMVAAREQEWRRALAEEIAGRHYPEQELQRRVRMARAELDDPVGFPVPSRDDIREAIPPGVGPALGSLLGWMAVAVVEDEQTALPDEMALRASTSKANGLGEDPDQGLIELSVGLSTDLIELQISTLEAMQQLVTRLEATQSSPSDQRPELAQLARDVSVHSRELFELSESIWYETDEPFQQAMAVQARGETFLASTSAQ